LVDIEPIDHENGGQGNPLTEAFTMAKKKKAAKKKGGKKKKAKKGKR
jgi:hypothetical protein